MKLIHVYLQKALFGLFLVCFSIVNLYIPHLFNEIPKAEASGAVAGATEFTQIFNNVELLGINAFSSVTAAATPVSAAMETSSFFLDNVLDGVAWSLAKNIVSQMTSSIVNWVNSGFQGSPSFVQDMGGFLERVADETVGAYLEDLGGIYSFICSPFKLDVRLALAVSYDQARAGEAASSCTLTGALANLENFVDGTQSFVDAGGWKNWFSVTTNPKTYTPYGSTLAAQSQASARLTNAKGEEIKLLDFGGGFLSSKICEQVSSAVTGSSTPRQNCSVSTPGKVISEALTFQLSTGPQSLIEADEINEIISAVFGQLAQQAITGAAGLLGLSGGTGHTYSGTPLTQQVAQSGLAQDPERLYDFMVEAETLEIYFEDQIIDYEIRLQAFADNLSNNGTKRAQAYEALDEMEFELLPAIYDNLAVLGDLITRFEATQYDPVTLELRVNPTELSAITQEFNDMRDLHQEVEIDGWVSRWESIMR